MQKARRVGVFVVLVSASLAFVACGDDGAAAAPPIVPAADGGPEADAPPACSTVYVSPLGSDEADGCTPTAPKKTMTAAMAVVSAAKIPGAEIHACAGVYREPALGLAVSANLRGGYDCRTWMRGAGFGQAGGFAAADATRLVTPEPNATATLTVERTEAHDVTLEGLVIEGRSGNLGSIALLVTGGASVIVTDVAIVGGNSRAGTQTVGSVGLQVKDATATIAKSRIDGGGGTGAIGSIGVRVENAKVDIRDSEIVAGGGVGSQIGAIGALFSGRGAERSTIARSTLRWGNDTADPAGPVAAYGVYAESGSLTLTGNAVLGGTALCHANACAAAGIAAAGSVELDAIANRIDGGDVFGEQGSVTQGIVLTNERSALVADNVVVLKGSARTVGIETDAAAPVIVNNTVVASTTADTSVGVNVLGAVNGAKGTGPVVDGNVLVATPSSEPPIRVAFGFRFTSCTGAKWASAKNNLVVNVDKAMLELAGNDCAKVSFAATPPEMTARLGSSVALGNVAIHAQCTDASVCLPVGCADGDECIAKLFPGHDRKTGGRSTLLADGAYRPAADLPCAIAKGFAMPPMATPAKDVYGAMRTTPFSLGAAEQESCAGE